MILKRKKGLYFKDILYLWLQTKEDVKIQSRQKYETTIKVYLDNNIGKIPLKKLTGDDINNLFKSLQSNNVSISVQKTLLYIIKSTLKFAKKNNYCEITIDDVKIKQAIKRVNVLSKEEQIKLENHLKENVNIRKICLLLCLYTGLRIGEICGLKWEDINLENKTLEVKRTIQRIKNDNKNNKNKTILIESTPKSDTSKRIIPIPDFVITFLKKFKSDRNYYLLSNSLRLYDPRQFRIFFERTLNKAGIKHTNFHTLRHTFATRSIESKMDIKTLSEILGHSSINITLELYVHPSNELKKASIENLVKFMTN